MDYPGQGRYFFLEWHYAKWSGTYPERGIRKRDCPATFSRFSLVVLCVPTRPASPWPSEPTSEEPPKNSHHLRSVVHSEPPLQLVGVQSTVERIVRLHAARASSEVLRGRPHSSAQRRVGRIARSTLNKTAFQRKSGPTLMSITRTFSRDSLLRACFVPQDLLSPSEASRIFRR